MPKVLVIYHSQSGNTEEMAKAVAEADPNTVSYPFTEINLNLCMSLSFNMQIGGR